MALFDLYAFICLLCKTENLVVKHFIKLYFKRKVFFSSCSLIVLGLNEAFFHMDRYSISVTVVYLLMCWRLKVGREDELAD